MMKHVMLAIAFVAASSSSAWCAEQEDQALVKAMAAATVSSQQGLTASSAQGQPISAKFELEDGKLQLSVYTAKDGKFSEVIVDHRSGRVKKAEPITGGDDLSAAQAEGAAMAAAKTSLKDAVDKAVRSDKGSRAVSVTPEMKEGRAVASVVLGKGKQLTTVEEPLN